MFIRSSVYSSSLAEQCSLPTSIPFRMFHQAGTNISRLLVSNCKYALQRNRASALLYRGSIGLTSNNTQQFSSLTKFTLQPLNVSLQQQRFNSEKSSSRNNKKKNPEGKTQENSSSTVNSVPKQEKEVIAAEDEEEDILFKTIQIEARSADRAVLDSYEKFVSMTAKYLDIEISRIWAPQQTYMRRTLLRSAFVKKKYRVQYEWRTYYRSIEFKHLTGSTANTFLEYIERNLPEGVAMKIFRHQLETIPEHLKPPGTTSVDQTVA